MTDKAKNTTAAIAGVAGAVVGAGMAVAATKIMTDKKMRDKVAGTLNQVKDQVFEALDENAHNKSQAQIKGGRATKSANDSGTGKKRGRPQKNSGASSQETEEIDMAM